MTAQCDNDIQLPRLKYPIHQYKVIRQSTYLGGARVIISRDHRERTREVFIFETVAEARALGNALRRARKAMRIMLGVDTTED